ncbi:hypothetical protein [uncultured Muribaculum sp.]|uniref:hypothetical protein n=1 Tax=uncultured Muribaculum sp. TaxID=1918613 RepID=UPI0025F716AD|nr:hypothetical protein [uncultured Muribaculum sp.]
MGAPHYVGGIRTRLINRVYEIIGHPYWILCSMADNYLERKMEEHRRGGGVPRYRQRVTSTGSRPGTVSFPFPVRRIMVSAVSEMPTTDGVALRDAVVKALCATGARVAFIEEDMITRDRLAQSSGACGVAPGDTAVVYSRWEGVDAMVEICAAADRHWNVAVAPYGDSRRAVVCVAGAGNVDVAVRAVLWCLVPGNDYLLGTVIDVDV